MMMNTHKIIAKSLLDNVDKNKKFLIDEKNFIYGNIKPDIFSKYKLKKHYLDESFSMIKNKIEYLASLDIKTLSNKYTKKAFNQEIGVVCHFLCDFFCVAHKERWEFKHSFKIHIKYETSLTKVAKEYRLKNNRNSKLDHNFELFFEKMYAEYNSGSDFEENDLKYSTYVCNSVLNFILDSILENTITKKSIFNEN